MHPATTPCAGTTGDRFSREHIDTLTNSMKWGNGGQRDGASLTGSFAASSSVYGTSNYNREPN